MSIKIIDNLLTINKFSRPGTKRLKTTKIAVHYVGNPNSTSTANRNYFENLKNGLKNSRGGYICASSHYIVGLCGDIVRCIPDDEIAYTTNSANAYSIGIECCHPDATGVFSKETREALIELVGDLLIKYNLTVDDIIRHYDVTGKACPLCWASNSGSKYEDYIKFKGEVKSYIESKREDKELSESVSGIIKSGIKIEYNKWKRKDLMKLADVPKLIEKLGGIDELERLGVIGNRGLWEKGEYKEEHIRALLIKYRVKVIK